MNKKKRDRGFSLIEVMVGLFLVAVAVLGLAQLFVVAVANNLQADRIANGAFLAQQQIDWLRGLTMDELDLLPGTTDEVIDLNLDGTNDFRRITDFDSPVNGTYHVGIHVYSAEKIAGYSALALLADPVQHRPRAFITTIITR